MTKSNKSRSQVSRGSNNTDRQEKMSIVTHRNQAFSGPIPPSGELAEYDRILPGAAERILSMAEKSQNHKNEMDIKSLEAHRDEVKRGQIFALIVTASVFLVCAIAMFLGYPKVANILGGVTIGTLATAFIAGKRSKKAK